MEINSQIAGWIERTNEQFARASVSCMSLAPALSQHYSEETLASASYVILPEVPKPRSLGLEEFGLSEFINMDVDGITYGNTYYIKSGTQSSVPLHFHELVHVVQWSLLGVPKFIERYLSELSTFGYEGAPLEQMAYELQHHFERGTAFSVEGTVRNAI